MRCAPERHESSGGRIAFCGLPGQLIIGVDWLGESGQRCSSTSVRLDSRLMTEVINIRQIL